MHRHSGENNFMTKRLLAVWLIFMASMGLAQGEETGLLGRMFDYTDMPSVPVGVEEARVIGSGDQIFFVDEISKEVSRLDGDATWKKIGKLDFEFTHEPIVSHAGDLYCVGVKSNGVQDVLKLSVNADSVSSSVVSSLPIELDGLKAAMAGGKLYVSGYDGQGALKLEVLNLQSLTPTWQSISPWPVGTNKDRHMVGLYSNLYVFGTDSAYKLQADSSWKPITLPTEDLIDYTPTTCGHAHVLFFEPGNRNMLAYYSITGQWVDSWQLPEPVDVAGVVSTLDEFKLIGYDKSFSAKAVIPVSTKYNWINYLTIALFMGGMIYVGIRLSRKEKSTDQYFQASSHIPWWASGLSMFATGASALSLMSMPGKAYAEDWLYMSTTYLVVLIVLPLQLLVFVPIIRRLGIKTSNEYLEMRFNLPIRLVGAFLFSFIQILVRLAGCMVLPAIAISSVFGISVETSIIVMGVVTTLYVYLGGLESVIWTDVLQAFIMLGTVLICFIWAFTGIDMPAAEAIGILQTESKLRSFDWAINFSNPTMIVFFLSVGIGSIYSFSDQNFVQRVQCTANEKQAKKALITSVAVAVPLNLVLFSLGTVLFLFYHGRTGDLSPAVKNDGVFPIFAAQNLPLGLAGLVVVSILAATMSTLSSAINSVANVFVEDYYRRLSKKATDKSCLLAGHIITALLGVVGTLIALWLVNTSFTSIWDMLIAAGGMLGGAFTGIFALGLFFKRTHSIGAVCGVIASLATTWYAQTYTHLNIFLYGVVGIAAMLVVGYLVSIIVPAKKKNLDGLTIFTMK